MSEICPISVISLVDATEASFWCQMWGSNPHSLLGTRRERGFEPRDMVQVKSVEGSIIETHGSTETKILEGSLQIPFHFQLVSKQVDLLGDRILMAGDLSSRFTGKYTSIEIVGKRNSDTIQAGITIQQAVMD